MGFHFEKAVWKIEWLDHDAHVVGGKKIKNPAETDKELLMV